MAMSSLLIRPEARNKYMLFLIFSSSWYNKEKGDDAAYMEQETQQQLEKIEGKPGIPIPPLLSWPTSIPGPLVTEPPQGQRRMSTRTDQVVEVEYNQETGTPAPLSAERSMPDQSQKE